MLGEWDDPYLTMAPGYQATIVRQLATFAEKGLVYKAKKSVHWCISCRTALAEAEVEYDEHHGARQIYVRFPLAAEEHARLAQAHPALRRAAGFGGHLDDDALDAAREPRARVPPRGGVRLRPVEGGGEVLLLAKALHEQARKRLRPRRSARRSPR